MKEYREKGREEKKEGLNQAIELSGPISTVIYVFTIFLSPLLSTASFSYGPHWLFSISQSTFLPWVILSFYFLNSFLGKFMGDLPTRSRINPFSLPDSYLIFHVPVFLAPHHLALVHFSISQVPSSIHIHLKNDSKKIHPSFTSQTSHLPVILTAPPHCLCSGTCSPFPFPFY